MNVGSMSTLVIFCIAGCAAAGAEPDLADATVGNLWHAGHIYYNVSTGERITTVIEPGDAQRPVDGEAGTEIWVMAGGGCEDYGSSTSFFYALDHTTANYGDEISPMLFDWGDIEMDTVVDCVQIHWISDHADTDTDSDGIADGVDGFAGDWVYWDGMNGRFPQLASIALPIVELSFFGLPGEYPPDTATVALWTAEIDLGGSFGSSLVFEIGDTDSDLQEAAVHNARMDLNDNDSDSIPDIDPDQDGRADWGWSLDFTQPGTRDVDNADSDSDSMTGIDGDPSAFATAGLLFGMPWPGHAEYDPVTDTWEWVTDGPPAGNGEDVFTLLFEDGNAGTFWFGGGFQCDPYVPAGMFSIVLYGPGGGCQPDLNRDGALDFFDVSLFLSSMPDYNGDTGFDFFDVSQFLGDFAAGCP